MKREKMLEVLPLDKDPGNHVLEVKIFYDMGGANYFSGGINRRGYYLSVSPVQVSEHSRAIGLFSGIKEFIKESARFSEKELQNITVTEEQKKKLIDYVLAKEKLTLKMEVVK